MSERIVLRTGEALVEADQPWSAAEPEVMIGELDGPLGQAMAQQLAGQVKGHTRVFALLNSDVQVKPATLMVSKVTVDDSRYTNILMGTVQAAIAHGVLDAVRSGVIPRERADELGIIVSVWLDPAVLTAADYDPRVMFQTQREAMARALTKAMRQEPSIDWLLEHQEEVVHYFHQLALDGEI
jgi:formaldehyde-activating enzyme